MTSFCTLLTVLANRSDFVIVRFVEFEKLKNVVLMINSNYRVMIKGFRRNGQDYSNGSLNIKFNRWRLANCSMSCGLAQKLAQVEYRGTTENRIR